jgi:hypothetical protein
MTFTENLMDFGEYLLHKKAPFKSALKLARAKKVADMFEIFSCLVSNKVCTWPPMTMIYIKTEKMFLPVYFYTEK